MLHCRRGCDNARGAATGSSTTVSSGTVSSGTVSSGAVSSGAVSSGAGSSGGRQLTRATIREWPMRRA